MPGIVMLSLERKQVHVGERHEDLQNKRETRPSGKHPLERRAHQSLTRETHRRLRGLDSNQRLSPWQSDTLPLSYLASGALPLAGRIREGPSRRTVHRGTTPCPADGLRRLCGERPLGADDHRRFTTRYRAQLRGPLSCLDGVKENNQRGVLHLTVLSQSAFRPVLILASLVEDEGGGGIRTHGSCDLRFSRPPH